VNDGKVGEGGGGGDKYDNLNLASKARGRSIRLLLVTLIIDEHKYFFSLTFYPAICLQRRFLSMRIHESTAFLFL
jgi:hypothetical protein